MKLLENIIGEKPLTLDPWYFGKVTFSYEDGEKLIFDQTSTRDGISILSGICLSVPILFALAVIFSWLISDKTLTSFIMLVFSVLLIYFLLPTIIKIFFCPKQQCIFNRTEQTITYPVRLYRSETSLFGLTTPMIKKYYGGTYRGCSIIFEDNGLYTFYFGDFRTELQAERAWSAIVWFMDKNRPYPEGLIFDPYRKKDFRRRKLEGFQAPLYKSNFEIYNRDYPEKFRWR